AVSLDFEILVINTEAVATCIFRLVEREISILEDLVSAIAVFWRERYSNAAPNNNRLSFNPVWRTNGLDEPCCQFLHCPFDCLLPDQDKHRKFIAAKASCDVDFADGGLDAHRHLLKEHVSSLVAMCVVDSL